jgi:diguanylate cyclase (GGDEF)-like protein
MKTLPLAARLYVASLVAVVTAVGVALAPPSSVASGGDWIAAAAGASLYVAYLAYKLFLGRIEDQQRHALQMSDLHLATIEALALAIDAKDEIGRRQSQRMQVYSGGLARALGMSETEIQGVKTASLLHDIGKLAVPEHILSKPGPLTQEEFQKLRVHPQVGAEIIGGVPFPYPVAPLILYHHERWDGNGYPAGLSGEEIPLGARILSLADHFDALTTERPHQRAVSAEAALDLLRLESGKALDPNVVETFVTLYPRLAAEADASDERPRRLERGGSESVAPTAESSASSGQSSVFHDIALAHREIYALYEIAQAMGSSLGVADTMTLIASKLSSLVPFSCCALFLRIDETGTQRCRFATGTDAELIQQLTVSDGQGLIGWVARNRRALVNARPEADLEAAGLVDVHTSLRSALVCPLVFNDEFIGTLSVYHTEPSMYTDDHRRLLDRISEQAAAVIRHSIVFERTQEDSLTDPLTKLPNTRFMLNYLARELARAGRLGSEVSLLVMDLDGFKEINDTYGHHVGDHALREVGQALQTVIRPYDICVRYAGDEFIVVLPGCAGEEAEMKRLELQHAIDDLKFEVGPDKTMSLAISAGAAIFPHDGDSYEALLATADGRMYADKTRRKRNSSRTGRYTTVPAGPDEMTDVELQRAAAGVL